MTWTYYVGDALTGQIWDEFPFSEFSFSRALQRPGGWSARLPRTSPKIQGDGAGLLTPNRTAVWAAKDGVLFSGGILHSKRNNTQNRDIELAGQGWWWYWRDRTAIESRAGMTYATGASAGEITFAAVDQFRIVTDLLAHVQTLGGAYPLTVGLRGPAGGGLSGVLRDRTYRAEERRPAGILIEQLAGVIDGPEFGVDWSWVGQTPTATLNLDYPTRGRPTGLVFEHGRNVTVLDHTENGVDQITVMDAFGSGQGDTQLVSRASSTDLYPSGAWPRLTGNRAHKTVSVAATLAAHAATDLKAAQIPVVSIKVELIGDADAQLGAFIEGDRVEVHAEDGVLDVHGSYRVQSYDVKIDSEGLLTIGCDLASNNIVKTVDEG